MDIKKFINVNGPEPLLKIIFTFQTLIYFTLSVGVCCFFGYLFAPAGTFFAGELFGVSMISLFIFVVLISTILSCVPTEVIEELKKQIREEMEKEEKEKEEKEKKEKER
jgi:uncharacterized membrane protein